MRGDSFAYRRANVVRNDGTVASVVPSNAHAGWYNAGLIPTHAVVGQIGVVRFDNGEIRVVLLCAQTGTRRGGERR